MEAVAADEHGEPHRQAEFRAFFEHHHRSLSRLAYLLSGDHNVADDIAADALTAAWSQWDRVRAADNSLAYVRRMVANLAASRLRTVVRERRRLAVLSRFADQSAPSPDVPAVVDLRAALMTLPAGKRACVILRYAFDLSESETASTLGISVGTVKSQTAKAVAELERILGSTERRPVDTTGVDTTGVDTTGVAATSLTSDGPDAPRGGAAGSGTTRATGTQPGSRRAGRRRSGRSGESAGPTRSPFARLPPTGPSPRLRLLIGEM